MSTYREEMKKTEYLEKTYIAQLIAEVLLNAFLVPENKEHIENLLSSVDVDKTKKKPSSLLMQSVFLGMMFESLIDEFLNRETGE